jgi:hypothetical protein
MAGYSATPLWKKLGYKAGFRAYVGGGPDDYVRLLGLPATEPVQWAGSLEMGIRFVHLFVTKAAELKRKLATCRKRVDRDGLVWVSWPKKSSKVETDITEDTIRELALPMGWVDIKVCAVTEVWSGLKLVVRRELR